MAEGGIELNESRSEVVPVSLGDGNEMKKDFVHLHLHTEYSLLDGSGKIKEMVAKAKEMGMKAMAITDHGAMYGTVDFYKACKEVGIKPIIGSEVYVCSGNMADRTLVNNSIHHLVLLVKNEEGYDNLMKIVSAASIDGFYYKPRVDHAFLAKHSAGLIALSACLGGEVQENLNHDQPEKAKAAAMFYRDTFQDGFYLELQDHGLAEQHKVNALNLALAKELNIPLICTNDVHYLNQSDSHSHDVLLCIQTAAAVDESDRMKYPAPQFYLKSPEEMWDLFGQVPEALENTVKVAEECNFEYEFHVSKLPNFDLPLGTDHFRYLKERCFEGLIAKYPEFSQYRNEPMNEALVRRIEEGATPEQSPLLERLNYELTVMKDMGYVDYFLIVWDFIKFADDHGIATGAGRGSAAGSIVAYTLNITKIDPIAYQLIFERFLNPERISMPDIDSDFCYERRQEVIDYVVEKYGKPNVAQIITFGTMAARACIRDVGRAMNYPYGEVDQIAKMIPRVLNITISDALTMNSELKNAYDTDVRVKELIDVALRLEGLPRHSSTHAAGVVISGKPLVEYVPLQRQEEAIVTQFPMGTLEELGLLKMDFLGLRTLTVMQDAIAMIRENRGVEVDIDHLDFKDEKIYQMISEGRTVGVFQLESAGMTSFMKELKPESLEDVIAGISLYRPGPMAEIPRYIKNRHNPDEVSYATPELKKILDVTYGVMVYQEQVMQIVQDLAGYSLARADLVRRAMSKKKHDVMAKERINFIQGIEENGQIVVPGTRRRGIPDEVANGIFDQMTSFASYAFNKSHAAAYAVVGYQTAHLVCYYPVEFTAAMLNSFLGSGEKASFYIRYAKTLGIELLPPDINTSLARFSVEGDRILFGLGGIKNVGLGAIRTIIEVRQQKGPYTSLQDFVAKQEDQIINKRALESLIKAGAFDSLKVPRSQLLAVYERVLESHATERKHLIKGQISFFGNEVGDGSEDLDGFAMAYPDIEEFPLRDRLIMEKDMTGLYLSGHPLDEYEEELSIASLLVEDTKETGLLDDVRDEAALTAETLMAEETVQDGTGCVMAGILTQINRKITRNNAMMAFATLEDTTGAMEVIFFPKVFDKVKNRLNEDAVVAISGRLQLREEEEPKLLAEDVEIIEKGTKPSLSVPGNWQRNGSGKAGHRSKSNATPQNPSLGPPQRSPLPPEQKKEGFSGDGPLQTLEKKPAKPSKATGQKPKVQEMVGACSAKLYLRFRSMEEANSILRGLKPFFQAHRGATPVMVFLEDQRQTFMLSKDQWVDEKGPIVASLKKRLGEANVVLKILQDS